VSRTEELRAKFRSKAATFGPEFSDFNSRVEKFLEKNRSDSAGSTDYIRSIYRDYKEYSPTNFDDWIEEKLNGKFVSRSKRPIWRYEPEWCFLDGEPMVFIHQFDTDYSTIYIFEGQRNVDGGYIRVLKAKEQDEEGSSRIDGEWLGR